MRGTALEKFLLFLPASRYLPTNPPCPPTFTRAEKTVNINVTLKKFSVFYDLTDPHNSVGMGSWKWGLTIVNFSRPAAILPQKINRVGALGYMGAEF